MRWTILTGAMVFALAMAAPAAAAGRLAGEWRVVDIDGAAPVEGTAPTLVFDGSGRVSGRGPCNRYFASYKIEGARIAVGQAGSTRMACAPERMEQERLFLGLLSAAAQWSIGSDGALALSTADGRVLRAHRGE